jgi:hypothetical protein
MAPGSEAPRDLADRVIRQALEHPANFRAFLHQAVPALAGGFDCERGRLLEREFPGAAAKLTCRLKSRTGSVTMSCGRSCMCSSSTKAASIR